jgi:hypothetical protein
MILKLLVKGHCWAEEEINFEKDRSLTFRENCEMKERYIELMTRRLKNKYQKSLEDKPYEIILTVQRRMAEIQEDKILKIA